MQVLSWLCRFLWRLVTAVLTMTGRLIVLAIGLALLLVGMLFTMTGIGAVIGVPLIALGLLLIARGIF